MKVFLPVLMALLFAAPTFAAPPESDEMTLVVYEIQIGTRGGYPAHLLATSAAAPIRHNVSLFAQRERYSTAQGSEVFGFESGAALRVSRHVDLTARYRILDHESIADDRDSEMSAPLLGVAFRF